MPYQVTEAEMKILALLWERSPLTITQITAELKEATGWDKHAVISLLKRMLAKGTIREEETKPAKRYYPLASREKVSIEQTRSLLGRLYEGKPVLLMSAMVREGGLSAGEIDELMEMLKRAREGESDV